jgi:hypothetical protein
MVLTFQLAKRKTGGLLVTLFAWCSIYSLLVESIL